MSKQRFPRGWDEDRVRRVIEYYDSQSDVDEAAEIDASFESTTHTMMAVPVELVPEVRDLIEKRSRD